MKKRMLCLCLTLLMILSLVPLSVTAEGAWMSFYVSPAGSDDAAGTQNAPFKTITRAQEEVRKHNKNMQGDIVVNLMPGRYELTEQLDFKLADSGSNGFSVIWQGTDPDNLPIISGAKEVTGTWVEGENGIWHTQTENLDFARNLFVNGRQAVRAKTAKKVAGGAFYTEKIEWMHRKRGLKTEITKGFYASKDEIGIYENPEDIEINTTVVFHTEKHHVKDIIQDPDNENQVIVLMGDWYPEFTLSSQDWKPTDGFVVENAYELLDMPGEFYFNRKTKRLSYIPYEGEDLNNAEVLVPAIEQLLNIHGGNSDNLLSNLKFKNVQFSHAMSNQWQWNDDNGSQGDFHNQQESTEGNGKFAIHLDWCKNVSFDSCVFYGIEPHCMYMKNGVIDSEVVGCVFADLGGHGIMGGSIKHDTGYSAYVPTDGPSDAAYGGAWFSSYTMNSGTARQQLNIGRSHMNSRERGTGWYSDPFLEENEYQWFEIEMLSKVKLESIEFVFPDDSTEIERSNFEIQVSNDRLFKNYETVASFTTPVDYKMNVDVESDKEWRYIRFMKTKVEDFCMAAVWAWSYDVMPQGSDGICVNNKIENCYFTRVGQTYWVAVPIFLLYTKDWKVIHNTIYDVPYSGMSIGWGWWHTDNMSAGGNEILYNYIDNVSTSSNDGGCLYIFGKQTNSSKRTQIRNNYFANATSGWGTALYMDSGHCGIDAYDNAALNVREAIVQNNSYGEVAVKNFYTGDSTTCSFVQVREGIGSYRDDVSIYYKENKTLFDVDAPVQYIYSNPPEAVTRIKAEAGIEDAWLWILDRVPAKNEVQNTILVGLDALETERSKARQGMIPGHGAETEIVMAQHIIDNGTFGNLPWNFRPEIKIELQEAISAFREFPSRDGDYMVGHIEDQERIKQGLLHAYEQLVHPSYEEMVEYCDAFAKEATTESYLQIDIDTFKKEVAEITSQTYEGRGDKAVAAAKLEKAYNKLWEKNRTCQLVDVVAENSTSAVDVAAKKITVYLPFNVNREEVKLYYFTGPNTEIATNNVKLGYATGTVKVPLRNTVTNRYDTWTVDFVESTEKGVAGNISVNPSDWTAGNVNSTYQNVADSLRIEPWFQPSMYKKLMEGDLSFSLWAPRADNSKGYSVIFGAQTCDDLDVDDYRDKNTFYMLKLVNQDITLYKVQAGKKTKHISVPKAGFRYGEFNNFEIKTTTHDGIDRICVKLNGKILMDTLVDEAIGSRGYFGILSKNIAVRVK